MADHFDPNDPLDAAAELVRKRICEALAKAFSDPSFTPLSFRQQMTAIMGGGLTALSGSLLAINDQSVHDKIMQALADYLPQARLQAESILKSQDEERH